MYTKVFKIAKEYQSAQNSVAFNFAAADAGSPHVPSSTRRGFTLIELIVAIGILVLVMGGGIATYSRLNKKQSLVNAGRETQSLIRSAQKKARAGEKPAGCDKLRAYSVEADINNLSQLKVKAICDSGQFVRDTYDLPNGVMYADKFAMQFLVLQGGVAGAADITLQSSTDQFQFTVDQGGQVTEGTVEAK